MNRVSGIRRRHPLAPPVEDMWRDTHWAPPLHGDTERWASPFDGDVLVTGATGFVAPFVVHQLLQFGSFRVICLARAESDEHATHRVRTRLAALGLGEAAASSRLLCLSGDLTLPHLGTSPGTLEALEARVSEVFHFASRVRWFTPYSAVRPCDVGGTHALLDFAARTRMKRVHVGASMGSQATVQGAASELTEESNHTRPDRLLGGYCQAKWVIERTVSRARAAGLPVNVFRLGDLKGASESGAGNAFDFGYSLMAWCLRRGVAPRLNYRVNYLPVDEVAACIVEIARRTSDQGQLFQFTNPQDARWDDVLDLMDAHGGRLVRLDLEAFSRRLRADHQTGAARRTKPSFRDVRPGEGLSPTSFLQLGLELYQRPHTTLNTASVLPEAPCGVRTRLLDDGLLQRYVRFATGINIEP